MLFFTAANTTDPASNWAYIYGIFTLHTFQTSMNFYWTGAFHGKNHCCLSSMSTTSTIFHCCCVEHIWLTGAPSILVEPDHIIIRQVRQETLPGTTFKKKKSRRHYLYTELRIMTITRWRWAKWAGHVARGIEINAYRSMLRKLEVKRTFWNIVATGGNIILKLIMNE